MLANFLQILNRYGFELLPKRTILKYHSKKRKDVYYPSSGLLNDEKLTLCVCINVNWEGKSWDITSQITHL